MTGQISSSLLATANAYQWTAGVVCKVVLNERENVNTGLFWFWGIFAIRDSSDHENNIRNPVVECSFSAFGYEHLVTTFTRLDIACGMLYGKDGRNRSRQTQAAETLDLRKPKQGLSLTRMVMYKMHTVCYTHGGKVMRYHLCLKPNKTSYLY